MSGDGLTPEQRDLSSTWGPHKAGSVDADTPGGRLMRTTVLPSPGAPGVGVGHEQTRPWRPRRECGGRTSVWTPAPRHAQHLVRAHPSAHLKALQPSRTTSTLLGEPGLQRRLPGGLPGAEGRWQREWRGPSLLTASGEGLARAGFSLALGPPFMAPSLDGAWGTAEGERLPALGPACCQLPLRPPLGPLHLF